MKFVNSFNELMGPSLDSPMSVFNESVSDVREQIIAKYDVWRKSISDKVVVIDSFQKRDDIPFELRWGGRALKTRRLPSRSDVEIMLGIREAPVRYSELYGGSGSGKNIWYDVEDAFWYAGMKASRGTEPREDVPEIDDDFTDTSRFPTIEPKYMEVKEELLKRAKQGYFPDQYDWGKQLDSYIRALRKWVKNNPEQ